MPRVLWLPAHPASGAVSMDRYWRELERERLLHSTWPGARDIACPLGPPPTESAPWGRSLRAWQKYAAYPWTTWRASHRPETKVVHVLDHSYAHLLAKVPRRGVFKIVTVHDLAPLRDPAGLTPAQLRRFRRTVDYLHEADLLLADSQHSAEETVDLLGVPAEKFRVLFLGVDGAKFSTRTTPGFPALPGELEGRKVVLSVGSNVARKNLAILPEVFRHLNGRGVTLLRIGAPLPSALRAELDRTLGAGGVLELGAASEETLVQAYQRADALIFPSWIEGFGFPVLEAMAAGCPVVCSDVTSLPEVGGDAALYFSPGDPAAAARWLGVVLNDPAARQRAVAAGQKQAAAFTWASHFEQLLEIYRAADAGSGQVAP